MATLIFCLSFSEHEICQSFAQELNNQNNALFLFNEGLNQYNYRRLRIAKEKFEEILKKYPKHPITIKAKIELAKVYKDLKEFDRAVELLNSVLESKEPDTETLTARELLISLLFELQRFKAGTELLEKLWKENPSDSQVGRNLAKFYLQSGRMDEAKVVLEGILERTTRRDVFEDLLGLAVKTGQVESLLSTIEQRKARYRTVDYVDFVTDCLLAMKQDEKAANTIREYPEARFSLPLLKKLARIDLSRNEHAKALESFQRIAKIMPMDWENCKAIGHCLFLLGKKNEAMETWNRWRRTRSGTEGYQEYTAVLIEHRLYEEALAVSGEARVELGNPTYFAEERAGILEALGRPDEALEEYFVSMANGIFKIDIFDKLFKSQSPKFDFKRRLKDALQSRDNSSLEKAFLEIHFRESELQSIPHITAFRLTHPMFDDILYERIRQDIFANPSEYLHKLIIALVQNDRTSTLAFKLASILLQVPDQEPGQASETLYEVEKTVNIEPCPDISLKIKVLVELARFTYEQFSDFRKALKFLDDGVNPAFMQTFPAAYFDGLLLLMRLKAYLGDFPAADAALQKAAKLVTQNKPSNSRQISSPVEIIDEGLMTDMNYEVSDQDVGFSPTALEDGRGRLLYEEAWLEAQKSNFIEALEKLKKLTLEEPGSFWVNDGLNLALVLTMGSMGSLDHLKNYMQAERNFATGSVALAVDQMRKISELASGTPLDLDARAQLLLMSEKIEDPASLSKPLDLFIRKNPNHWTIPDLMMLQWRLMRRMHSDSGAIVDLLKDFTDRFPGDLRCRRVKSEIANIVKGKK